MRNAERRCARRFVGIKTGEITVAEVGGGTETERASDAKQSNSSARFAKTQAAIRRTIPDEADKYERWKHCDSDRSQFVKPDLQMQAELHVSPAQRPGHGRHKGPSQPTLQRSSFRVVSSFVQIHWRNSFRKNAGNSSVFLPRLVLRERAGVRVLSLCRKEGPHPNRLPAYRARGQRLYAAIPREFPYGWAGSTDCNVFSKVSDE